MWGMAAGVDGKSVQARVALSGWPAATVSVKVRLSPVEPPGKAGAWSLTNSLRGWPSKCSAFSSSTRPQPWQLEGMAVAPVMDAAEFTSVARISAAEGVKPFPATSRPVGYQPST